MIIQRQLYLIYVNLCKGVVEVGKLTSKDGDDVVPEALLSYCDVPGSPCLSWRPHLAGTRQYI